MLSAILSFIGGSAFRMIWGEVSAWLKAKQEHLQEMDRMRLSEQLEQSRHTRQQELINLQHALGLQTIQLQGDIESEKLAAQAFLEAQKTLRAPSGIKWIDGWNAGIRPLVATITIVLWLGDVMQKAWALTEWDKNLIGAVLGFYFVDRSLKHRGK